jgi:hypothetical protein
VGFATLGALVQVFRLKAAREAARGAKAPPQGG